MNPLSAPALNKRKQSLIASPYKATQGDFTVRGPPPQPRLPITEGTVFWAEVMSGDLPGTPRQPSEIPEFTGQWQPVIWAVATYLLVH